MIYILDRISTCFICFITKQLGAQIWQTPMTQRVAYTLTICVTLEDPPTYSNIQQMIARYWFNQMKKIHFYLGRYVRRAFHVSLAILQSKSCIIQKIIKGKIVILGGVINQKSVLSIIVKLKIIRWSICSKNTIRIIKKIIKIKISSKEIHK